MKSQARVQVARHTGGWALVLTVGRRQFLSETVFTRRGTAERAALAVTAALNVAPQVQAALTTLRREER